MAVVTAFPVNQARATPVPSTADVSRIKPQEPELLAPPKGSGFASELPTPLQELAIPPQASSIRFVLRTLDIVGATAFTQEQLADLYAPLIGKEISLDQAYRIANQITRRYRDAGYFVSMATVPDQQIQHGHLKLEITEGFVSDVELSGDVGSSRLIQEYIARLKAEKPLNGKTLERFLLQLNDLPGISFRAVLSPQEHGAKGAVKLSLLPVDKKSEGTLSFDNFSSRFLGPYQVTASYSASVIPLEQTSVSFVESVPQDRLSSLSLSHRIPLVPDVDMELSGAVTNVSPEYTLKSLEIVSRSTDVGLGVNYQWLRSRQKNLSLGLKLNGRDTTSKTLGTEVTHDIIRAVRANATFDISDAWQGYSTANAILSQGINSIGANHQDPTKNSRSGAAPDFTKLELYLARLQRLDENWSFLLRGAGQMSSGTLYSAEEFGYGGQGFGRAFDASELIGDQGIAGSAEARYDGLSTPANFNLQPFYFYDAAIITNYDASQRSRAAAASTGGGLRFNTEWDQSGMVSVAVPVGHKASNPLYGTSRSGPRLSFQFSQKF